MSQQTIYGTAHKGKSRFIVVAPHGLDDLHTAEVAENLARSLDASLLINSVFVKPSNPLASESSQKVWDFNKLPWYTDSGSYIDNIYCDGLRAFVQDLLDYTRLILIEHETYPTIVYIHGMKDRPNLGLDIGIGVRIKQQWLLSAGDYAKVFLSDENIAPGWSVIADVRSVLKLRTYWQNILQNDRNVQVGIGEIYFTGRPEQLPQIHRHLWYESNSLQIEISRSLREDMDYTVALLSDGLGKVYL